MRTLIGLMTICLGLAQPAAPVQAQDLYPSKPLRLVVPLQPGGPTDHLARAVAQRMASALGQPVVVDNKPGADGLIAARDVMAAPADGHTLLFAIGSMIATPLQSRPPAFDWLAELAPVGKVGRLGFCLVVHPDVPATSVSEFVAWARAHPDQLNYATSTMSELMAAAQFMRVTGIRMNRVPYKGGTQAMPDLLAGRIQVMFGPMALALQHSKTGGVRVLASLLPQRSPLMPMVPTLAEAGYPGVSVPTWQSIFVPARTPAPVVARLAAELDAVLGQAELRADFEGRAVAVEPATPQALAATVVAEQAVWRDLIAEYRLGAE